MKTIITILTLCLLLSFTGKSQSITVKNNELCFDSAAAVEVYKTIVDRESLSQEVNIYQEIFATYDSMNIEKDELIELQKVRVYNVEKELLAEKNRHLETIADNKKQKRRLIFSFSSITIIAVLTSILVSR